MAAATLEVYVSGASSITINYDDSTLIVSGVTMVCATPNPYPLIFYFTHGGSLHALQCNPGTSGTWSTPGNSIKGTAVTNSHGFQTVDLGFIGSGVGFGVIAPNTGQIVIVG